jgi:serine/threonine-protein kinase
LAIEAGQQLLQYRLIERIGEGGMGVVWKALDTTLDREVAIKFLPDALQENPDRLARFEREAKLLASLDHPGIAAVYGLHEDRGKRFLAMEYVNGEDLGDRLSRGELPVEDALELFGKICEALEAAHDAGVVHRDLKPANVMVTSDGKVKVLDFGLAKALSPEASSAGDPQTSPTVTSAQTAVGMILGTAGYMSPEQARGHPVDARADVWAFGCLAYEVLTGRRAFEGQTVSDTLASVLRSEPDMDALPQTIPPRLRRLIRRCLTKDSRDRLRHAGDVRLELADCAKPEESSPARGVSTRAPRTTIAVLAAAVALASVVAVWGWLRSGPPSASRTVRFEVVGAPADSMIDPQSLAVSEDGRRIVWAVTDGFSKHLVMRELRSTEIVEVPDTDGATRPAFSPDGNSIAFFAKDKLRRFDLGGRNSIDLCDAIEGAGISWREDDTIIYNDSWIAGLFRVSADGGQPEAVTQLDEQDGEIGHWFPDVLPGGRDVLITRWRTGLDDTAVAVASLETGESRDLIPRASDARYLSSGHIAFSRTGAMYVVPFDLERLEVTGDAVEVLPDVNQQWSSGSSPWDVSRNGVLVYLPGGLWSTKRTIVRVARDGTETPLPVEPGAYLSAEVSPDGGKLVVTVFENGKTEVVIRDLTRGTDIRVPLDAVNTWPLWSPDGSEIVFTTARSGPWDIYRMPADGSSQPQPLVEDSPDQIPLAWSSDGGFLVWQENYSQIRALDFSGDRSVRTIDLGGSAPQGISISPDSRWIAYAAWLSGRREIFVRRFPDGMRAYQVSVGGGDFPLWSRDGRQVLYRAGDAVFSVSVRPDGEGFVAERPEELFRGDFLYGQDPHEWSYDASTDSLVMIRNGDNEISRHRLTVVVDGFADLAVASNRTR